MNKAFPAGFPTPTAFYLTLYMLTFVLHQIFMHYVLAGSLYVAWATIWPGHGSVPRAQQRLAAILRDWMPFLLSAAITAGIAPLLFIQIVYRPQFYTANLLLWWRWMIVVPVLIAAFYLLYLIKSSFLWRWPYAMRVAVTLGTSICFVFVGFCWTVNHLLAISEADWPTVYATGRLPFSAVAIASRMLIWIGGSFATMSVIVSWQLFHFQRFHEPISENEEHAENTYNLVRTMAEITGAGIGVALLAGLGYITQCDEQSRGIVFGPLILPYVFVTVAGIIGQGIGWSLQWRASTFTTVGLAIASFGTVLSLLGVTMIREGLRLRAIDLKILSQRHAEAAMVGGFGVFLVSATIVLLVIAWCVRIVRRGIVA